MEKSLFIVCPFSRSEPFLCSVFGGGISFHSAPGATLNDADQLSLIYDVVKMYNIDNIVVVNDISCIFINNIVRLRGRTGAGAELYLEDLFIENYFKITQRNNPSAQSEMLAEINITSQIQQLRTCSKLMDLLRKKKTKIVGLLTDLTQNRFRYVYK